MRSPARRGTPQSHLTQILRVAAVAVLALAMALIFAPRAAPAFAAQIPGVITAVSVAEDSAANWSEVEVEFTFTVPTGTVPGDTFSLTLPAKLSSTVTSFNLTAPDGSVIARAEVVGKVVTFTFTDYVSSHQNVSGSGFIWTMFNSTAGAGENVTITFVTNSGEFEDGILVTETIVDRNYVAKSGGWTNVADQGVTSPNGAISWMIASARGPFPELTFSDPMRDGQRMECDTLEVLSTTQVDPATGELQNLTAVDTSRYSVTCTPEKFVVTLPAGSAAGEVVVIQYRSTVTDATFAEYPNTATINNGTSDVEATATVERSGGAGGTGAGNGLGELRIVKALAGEGAAGKTGPFTVEVICSVNAVTVTGFPKQYTFSGAGSFTQAVPLGAVCSATETETGGAVLVEVSDEVTIGEDPETITVTNHFDGPEDPGPVKPVTPTTQIANTGATPPTPLIIGAIASTLIGLAALTASRLRRRAAIR